MADRTLHRLQELAAALPAAQAAQLLEFAEFLHARHAVAPVSQEPLTIPRPMQESVVKAIRRLADTYPMLDRGRMLNETSALMTAHMIQGRAATEVIDELEIVFRRHYEKHAGGNK